MKNNSIWSLLPALACGASILGAASISTARDGADDFHQEVERVITLSPAGAAPADATGTAEIEVGRRGGTNKIEIHLFGLPAGAYLVTLYDRAGTAAADLGTISAGAGGSDDSGHHGGDGATDDGGAHQERRRGGDHGGDDGDVEGEFILPADVNALDFGRLVIRDGAGNEFLAGDLSDLSSTTRGRIVAQVPAVAGQADDDAAGVASIRGRIRAGRGAGTFSLSCRNLPPSSTLHLVINGEDAGIARTDRRGRLRVHRNHRSLDLFSVSTVSARDDSGGELVRAQF